MSRLRLFPFPISPEYIRPTVILIAEFVRVSCDPIQEESFGVRFRHLQVYYFRGRFAYAQRVATEREGKRMSPLLHLARDDKERASSIDEQRIVGIALFFSPFLSASSDPFVRNFFVLVI